MATKEALDKLIRELKNKTVFDFQLAKKILFSRHVTTHNVPEIYQIAKQKKGLSPVVINCLLAVHARKGNATKALRIIDDATRDGVPYDTYWNSNVACAQATDGHYQSAIRTLSSLHKFKSAVFLPSFPTLIHSLGSVQEGLDFCMGEYKRMVKTNVLIPENVYCALLVQLGSAGRFLECMELFQQMKDRGVNGDDKTYSVVIKACLVNKKAHEAFSILLEMKDKKVIPHKEVFPLMIDVFGKMGDIEKCKQILEEMESCGVRLDSTVYNTLLYTLANSDMVGECDKLLLEMQKNGISPNTLTYNTLLFGHGSKGDLKRVNEIFEEMKERQVNVDLITYNAMINAYAKVEKMEICEAILTQLVENGYSPNQQTYTLLLDAYYEMGNKEKVEVLYDMMVEKGYSTTSDKFNALVRSRVPWHMVESYSLSLFLLFFVSFSSFLFFFFFFFIAFVFYLFLFKCFYFSFVIL